jgi:hypothetical protein
MRITKGPLSFTWEQNTEQGLLVTLTDDDAEVTVELLLGDWAPWEGQAKPTTRRLAFEDPTGRKIRVPLERYEGFVADSFAELMALGGDDRYRQSRGQRQRRIMTDEFLRAVADAYSAAGGNISGITPDRDHRFHASDSQKFRWVKAARERFPEMFTDGPE